MSARIPNPLVLVLAVAGILGTASAAILLSYTNASTVTLGARGPPVLFEAGADSVPSDYVPTFALSTNRTTFSTTLRGVPEATVTIGELARIRNADASAHTVTLRAAQVTNAFVTAYRIELLDGASVVATLDLKAASPSATFELPAGTTLGARAVLALAAGAGAHNVNDARAIALAVTA